MVLNLWRNGLLLLVGILHMMLWDGDVLMVYALSSVFLIALRKLPNRALISLALLFSCYPWSALWSPGEITEDQVIVIPFLLGYFLRALGLILVGAGLYRDGFMNGDLPAKSYRTTALVGLAVGLPLAAVGVIITVANDYSREIAFIGQIPNLIGSILVSLGYMSLIILWNNRADNWLKRRLRAVGRMALTNYLAQTVLGMLVLRVFLGGRRLCDPKCSVGVCIRGLGGTDMVVASLA